MKKSEIVRKTFSLPKALAKWLESAARKEDRSASNFLARIIEKEKGR